MIPVNIRDINRPCYTTLSIFRNSGVTITGIVVAGVILSLDEINLSPYKTRPFSLERTG